MTKSYLSRTEIFVNVRVGADRTPMHIRFGPLCSGGSFFATADPQVQQALEQHRHFGRLFVAAPQPDPAPPATQQQTPVRNTKNGKR